MTASQLENDALQALKKVMHSYAPISSETWARLISFVEYKEFSKSACLYPSNVVPCSFAFVYKGLFRVYTTSADGYEYNKKFFDEGTFPGSMAALLTDSPSQFSVESLEPSAVLLIDFKSYRELLMSAEDLKLFHILYLEKNWLLEKDAREVEIVQEDALQRYRRFLARFPSLSARIPQYHVASHLGITPTQLSRIRKKL